METVYELNDSHQRSSQPSCISIALKPHQLTSLHCMVMSESGIGNVAILADMPGYGKTITFLSLVQELKDENYIWKPFSRLYSLSGDSCVMYDKIQYTFFRLTVIVVPNHLVRHWKHHIESYTGLIFDTVTCKDDISKILLTDIDVLIVMSSLFIDFLLFSREMKYAYNRIAFDEADSISIPKTKYMLHARFMWLITSTYKTILYKNNNDNKFLSHVFRSRQTNFINPVVIRCDPEYILSSFDLLEPQETIIRCLTPVSLSVLREHVSSKIIHYMNAGNIEQAIIELGGNVDTERNLFLLMEKKYNKQICHLQCELNQVSNEEETKKLHEKLQKTNSQYNRFREQLLSLTTFRCPICYDNLNTPTLLTCCNNVFCASCILQWNPSTKGCPLCRRNTMDLYTITTEEKAHVIKKTIRKKTKYENVVSIVHQHPSCKVLIFADSHESFCILYDYLHNASISTKLLDSSCLDEFHQTVDSYRFGSLQVLCIVSTIHGAGIELPETTDVILLHRMSRDLELQSIARAQRIGRITTLNIWKLYHAYE